MTDRMQTLMDGAYARWRTNEGLSKEAFWDQLNADERFAVFLGNLNYQVENGGFDQWHGNGYATPETTGYILRACERIGTDAAKKVAELVRKATKILARHEERGCPSDDWDEVADELDEMDRAFYAINAQFLADAEAHLAKGEK